MRTTNTIIFSSTYLRKPRFTTRTVYSSPKLHTWKICHQKDYNVTKTAEYDTLVIQPQICLTTINKKKSFQPPHPLTGLLFLNQEKEIFPAASFALANCLSRGRDFFYSRLISKNWLSPAFLPEWILHLVCRSRHRDNRRHRHPCARKVQDVQHYL